MLSEEDKVNIIKYQAVYGNQWTVISRLIHKNPTTIKQFYVRYQKTHSISPKRGRPFKVTPEDEEFVVDLIEADPKQHLQELAQSTNLSKTTVKKVLNKNSIKYYNLIKRPPLTDQHKANRLRFVQSLVGMTFDQLAPIIFSDESTVCVNLRDGGIWRRRGEHPPEAFYDSPQKPKSVMIWGCIGPNGWRSDLICVNGTLNAENYIKMLQDCHIFDSLDMIHGRGRYWFQQDNAPAHTANETKTYLHVKSNILHWPPKSPDLNPIEQVWNFIKHQLAGEQFTTEQALFNRIREVWWSIPSEMLHQFHSSFLARCQTVMCIDGANLNGNWKQVRSFHDQYRV